MKKYPLYYHKKLKIFFVLLWKGKEEFDRKDIFKVREVVVFANEKSFSRYKYAYLLNKRLVFIENYPEFCQTIKVLNA